MTPCRWTVLQFSCLGLLTREVNVVIVCRNKVLVNLKCMCEWKPHPIVFNISRSCFPFLNTGVIAFCSILMEKCTDLITQVNLSVMMSLSLSNEYNPFKNVIKELYLSETLWWYLLWGFRVVLFWESLRVLLTLCSSVFSLHARAPDNNLNHLSKLISLSAPLRSNVFVWNGCGSRLLSGRHLY